MAYAELLERILNAVDAHRSAEKREILREATVQVDISDSVFIFFRDQLESRITEVVLGTLNPIVQNCPAASAARGE